MEDEACSLSSYQEGRAVGPLEMTIHDSAEFFPNWRVSTAAHISVDPNQ